MQTEVATYIDGARGLLGSLLHVNPAPSPNPMFTITETQKLGLNFGIFHYSWPVSEEKILTLESFPRLRWWTILQQKWRCWWTCFSPIPSSLPTSEYNIHVTTNHVGRILKDYKIAWGWLSLVCELTMSRKYSVQRPHVASAVMVSEFVPWVAWYPIHPTCCQSFWLSLYLADLNLPQWRLCLTTLLSEVHPSTHFPSSRLHARNDKLTHSIGFTRHNGTFKHHTSIWSHRWFCNNKMKR